MRKGAIRISSVLRMGAVVIAAFVCSTQFLFAQEKDIVSIRNGDRITGEIRKFDRGRLEFKIEHMGTVNIEWDVIDSIQSRDLYDIELKSGEHYFGSLEMSGEAGTLKIKAENESELVSIADVVSIFPLESTFWQRVKGYLDAGLSYQSADEFVEITLGADTSYRTERWASNLALSTYLRTHKEGSRIRRNNISYRLQRIFKQRWSGGVFGTLEQNDELELDMRALLGVGMGRDIIQNNKMLFQVFAGLDIIQEKRTGDESFATNFEALLGSRLEAFRYSSPRLDYTASLLLFPNLTELGRLRIYFDTRLRYEILRDFFIGLTVFDQFDGDLREGGTRNNDFGINSTISWSFK